MPTPTPTPTTTTMTTTDRAWLHRLITKWAKNTKYVLMQQKLPVVEIKTRKTDTNTLLVWNVFCQEIITWQIRGCIPRNYCEPILVICLSITVTLRTFWRSECDLRQWAVDMLRIEPQSPIRTSNCQIDLPQSNSACPDLDFFEFQVANLGKYIWNQLVRC